MPPFFRAPPNSRFDLVLVAAIPAQAGLLLGVGWMHGALGVALPVALLACLVGLACVRLPIERWYAAPGIGLALVVPVLTLWQLSGLQPVLLLDALLTMSVMASMLKPGVVAAAGLAMAVAPFALAPVANPDIPTARLIGFAAFLLVQTALLVGVTARNARRSRERFDIEFLVRAMGSEGAIRLGLDAVRAESALGTRLKQVQQRMAEALRQVRQAAEGVRRASHEIDASGGQLSERTERGASGLREAAMTLEQITVIVQSSAQAAQEAKAMATMASERAAQGGELFNQVTERMKAIDQSSRRITEVIGVIDGIAFQTNILALNAAVEAARAGEQGRGFAVVAHEVRQLALRAGEAAGEVRRLINESLETVRGGNQLVDEAGRTMDDIVTSVRKVGQVFENLSDDTHEHAGSIEAVTQSVSDLDAMTRQNVAVVETARRIAHELLEQGAQLDQVLGSFKLGGAVSLAAPAAQPLAVPTPARHEVADSGRAARAAARGEASAGASSASPRGAATGATAGAASPTADTVTFF